MMYRYLPTPSDRMGIIWTLLTIKDAVVLEYGPAGTTHFSVGTYGAMGLETNQRIFTTHLGENDVIMGDTTRLEEAIVEIDENYNPKIIFVVSSAVVSIIGTDMKGICHYMQEEVKARLIPIETGGFKGDYSLGLKNGWNIIVKELCQKGEETDSNFYNIIGASPYNYRIKSDVNELQNLMKESFNMKCNVVLGQDASISELENMGKACINLVIQEEAIPAAEYMQEKLDIPFVYGAPYGYKGTKTWLSKISEVIKKDISFAVVKELQEKIMECAEYKMYSMMFANKKTAPASVIVGEYDTVDGLANAMAEVFLPVNLKLCNHSVAGLDEMTQMSHPKTEKEKLDLIKSVDKCLVFGDDVTLHVVNNNCTKVIASAPLIARPQIASHLPFMGIHGMDYILEQVESYYNSL